MNYRRGPFFPLIVILITAFFWIIGLSLIALEKAEVIHIQSWIIGIQFWGPYAGFTIVLAIVMIRCAVAERIARKRRSKHKGVT